MLLEYLFLKVDKVKAAIIGLLLVMLIVSTSLLVSYSKLQYRYNLLEQSNKAQILLNEGERAACSDVLIESQEITEEFSTLRSELKASTSIKNKEITLNEVIIAPKGADTAIISRRLLCRAKLAAPGLCKDTDT